MMTPSARLVGVMRLAHLLDLAYAGSPCAAVQRADSTRFVIRKSQLPSATQRALLQAIDVMLRGCATNAEKK